MQAATRVAGIARNVRELGNMMRVGRRSVYALPAQRHYTSTVLEREAERAESASGLLAQVGGKRLAGAGFEVHGGCNGHLHSAYSKGMHISAGDVASVSGAFRKGVNVASVGGCDVPARNLGVQAAELAGGAIGAIGAVASASAPAHLAAKVIDPFRLMEPQLKALTENLRTLVGADNKIVNTVARYFFDQPGKRFRPALVLLVAQASPPSGEVTVEQQRLAEITEMIHTASLLHDDVMDHAEVRRGIPALNSVHGNKLAVLAGDFLLSRASLNLARLKNVEVIELLSTVIAHLVEGEIMQSRTDLEEATNFDYYMRKTYLKTASLLAHSCQGVVLLGKGKESEMLRASQVAFEYGKHLGMAFQLQDDVLDFEGDLKSLGKAPGSDLREGLTTAPVLFALEEPSHRRELTDMIQRGYKGAGDVERAMELIKASDGIKKSKELALLHSAKAIEAANSFEPSTTRDALIQLAHMVVSRKA